MKFGVDDVCGVTRHHDNLVALEVLEAVVGLGFANWVGRSCDPRVLVHNVLADEAHSRERQCSIGRNIAPSGDSCD